MKKYKKIAVIIASLIILSGSITCILYNNIMVGMTRQQLDNSASVTIKKLDTIFTVCGEILEREKNLRIAKLTPVMLDKIAEETNIDYVSAWFYSNNTIISNNETITLEHIQQYVCSRKDTTYGWHITEPYFSDEKGYIDEYINMQNGDKLGLRIPLETILNTAHTDDMFKFLNVHTWLIDHKGKIIGDNSDIKQSSAFDLSSKFLTINDTFNQYISSDGTNYIGIQAYMPHIQWTLICATPVSILIGSIIFTDIFFSLIIIITSVVLMSLIYSMIKERKLRQYDSLTDTYTLYAFCKKSRKYLKKRPPYNYCLVQMDILTFNVINERYGMLYGDNVLKKIAKTLKKILPVNSLICRVHSDVFCFITQYIDETEIYDLLKQITGTIHDIEKSHFPVYYGIYLYDENIPDIRSAMEYVNFALKEAKAAPIANRNYCVFKEEMLESINFNSELQSEMYDALENGQFKVYLQPKCSMTTGDVVGAEALVRWEHPEKGLLSPNLFIPLFEKNGFIKKLDEFMWNTTADIIADWMAQGYKLIPISVNISRAQKLGYPLCKKINKIVTKHNIPAKYLELEFTESAFSENIEELYETMKKLHADGFTVLMDDFGSGYSSLNMLKECPADIIKIDKEFLHSGYNNKLDENSIIIIQHIIKMLHKMNLGIVAEGVETKEHIELLIKCGCDVAQGYYYSPPVPVNKFNEYAVNVLTNDGEIVTKESASHNSSHLNTHFCHE